jgi:ankyrin repeat protein
MSAIHDAAAKGDIQTIKKVVEGGFLRRAHPEAVNEKDERLVNAEPAESVHYPVHIASRGWTPLHYAAYSGRTDVVRYLLEHGADTNERNDNFVCAVELAILACRWETADAILKVAPQPNLKNFTNYGVTLIHWCATAGQMRGVSLLLTHGADPNSRANNGETPLFCALTSGHMEIATFLLGKGADINAQDRGGATYLHWCARQDWTDTAIYLLDHGARTDIQNDRGQTPLQLAIEEKHNTLADTLRARGAMR